MTDTKTATPTITVKRIATLTGLYGTHLAFDREGNRWALADRRTIQLGRDGTLDRKLTAAEPLDELRWSLDDKRLLAGPQRYDLERDAWQQLPALREALTAGLDEPPPPDQLGIVAAATAADAAALVLATRVQPSRGLGDVDRYRGPRERLLVLGPDGALRGVLYAGDDELRALAISDRFIAAGGEPVQVWDRRSLRKVADLPHSLVARALAFDAAGDRLAVITASGEVAIWDVAAGKQLASFHAHDGDGTAIAFHPTLPLIATGGQDGKLRLWSTAAPAIGTPLYEEVVGGWVQAVAFAATGSRLAAVTRARPPHLLVYELSSR